MSAGLSPDTDRGAAPETGVRVQVHFGITDERAARAVAAKLIDRAHEIANLPECECDVDVSVEWVPPGPAR